MKLRISCLFGAFMLTQSVSGQITKDYGELQLPELFQEEMVYQQKVPFLVYGQANTGTKVQVDFRQKQYETTTNPSGRWEISLPGQNAGGPHRLMIKADTTIHIDSVYFGEVWLASGQSNMAFPLKRDSFAAHTFSTLPDESVHVFNRLNRAHPSGVVFDSIQLDLINRGAYYHPAQWASADSVSVANFSAIGYYFGQMLADSLQCPIGIIHNAIGGSNTESWIPRNVIEQNEDWASLLNNWKDSELVDSWVKGRASKNLEGTSNTKQRHPFEPGYLFDAAIDPICQYPIAGVIWYQGESNASDYELHTAYFTTLIDSWRAAFDIPDLPFLYVQLSSINRPTWPVFRYSQLQVETARPQLGMVVSSDLGHPTDVHPTNKRDIGYRLGAKALDMVYGFGCISSGPRISQVTSYPYRIKIMYDNAGSGLVVKGNKARGFEMAAENGLTFPAKAKVSGNTIILRSWKVKKPKYVRYGWQPYSLGNIFNSFGFPASTDMYEIENKP